MQGGSLLIEKSKGSGEVACIFFSSNGQYKFTGLYGNNDEDAKRLRNALEHLIKLLQAEPDQAEPFANWNKILYKSC